ncbi:MAG: ABC transporter substrate-binding protein [Erysipelotrichales bacterium]
MGKSLKKGLVLFSVLFILLFVGGCSSNDKDAAKVGDYEPVTIKNGERTITFKEMPKKVFVTNLYGTENMVMLGLEDKVVGKNVKKSDAEVPLPELKDKFKSIPEIERSHENVVSLGTDLIIGQISTFGDGDNGWGDYELFDNKGINTYTISGTITENETIENVYEDITNLGKIFKVEDRADKLINDIKSKISEVNNKVKDVNEKDKVKVFVLDSFKGNEIYTTSKGLQSDLISHAGAINVTKDMAESRWFNTSVETLVKTNPDVIVLNDYGVQTIKEKKDFLKNNAALKNVSAVKNNKFVVIPLVEVMQDYRAALATEKMAKAFYPDLFKG